MTQLHLVFGAQGAGKSTYALQLAAEFGAVRFSIDEWMGELYGPDMPQPLDLHWIMARVRRCEQRIWSTALQVIGTGGRVVLDLGFMKVADRSRFLALAEAESYSVQLHPVTAPLALRRERVLARNAARGETFAFEVTPAMFDFMESQFEAPSAEELARATLFSTA
ncbi:MAG: ATP-binding protein [Pseudomonas sp.]|uniref:AAA family ATPase n=1 Tax=Pseudomonas sp. TaxID=306 RepID=UPI003399F2F0